MKQIDTYISEKLKLDKNLKITTYKYFPETKEELRKMLEERLAEDKNANLNDIDVSEITDMGIGNNFIGLFEDLAPHNIDISEWNVSNVKDMSNMFVGCLNLKCNLSKWDVSNVTDMSNMFFDCENFNSDVSNWNASNVTNMENMFFHCHKFNSGYPARAFNTALSKWDVSNVTDMNNMFRSCYNFNCDLNNWDVSKVINMDNIFKECNSLQNKPSWYKE